MMPVQHHLAILVMSWWRHQAKNEGIHVKYSNPPTKDPLYSKTMVVIAVMRGKPKDGFHRSHSNKHYKQNHRVTCKVQYYHWTYPPEVTDCCCRGNGKPKNGYHHSNKHYLWVIVRVLLDRGHNGHLDFVTKDKPMLFPYSKRLVPQLWNTLNGIFRT